MFDPCVGVSDVCPHHPTALGLVVVQVVLSALLFVDGAVVEGVDEAVHAQASGLVVGGTAGRPKHHRVTTCQKGTSKTRFYKLPAAILQIFRKKNILNINFMKTIF